MKQKSSFITKIAIGVAGLALFVGQGQAQVLLSGGAYNQNFDTLPSTVGNNPWVNGVTLSGWYCNALLSPAVFGENGAATNIIAANVASGSTGAFYSYASNGVSTLSDRSMGSVGANALAASGQPMMAYGVRFVNDTGEALTNFTVSYTGEQWRANNATDAQGLTFSYRIDSSPITYADPTSTSNAWTSVSALNFTSPIISTAGALDGNASANRALISFQIQGFALFPGQEIFFRWVDRNDAGNDHALAIDDLTISFQTNETAVATAPVITVPPASQTIGAGSSATFNVTATGTQPFFYEWYATNSGVSTLVGTSSSFTTNNVAFSLSGLQFYVVLTNSIGSATSVVATLTVTNVSAVVTNIGYLHTLQNANFVLTNTTTLFSATGIVTTTDNLTSGSTVSFHIQDETGGIDVFYYTANGPFLGAIPNAGDLVRVTAPLAQFNGLLEFSPTNANPTHELTLLSSGNPVPAPLFFDFTTINPAVMESTYEGRLVIVSNVFLAVTNTSGVVVSGQSIYMTNLTGQTFRLINPQPAIDPQGLPVPAFATSVRGVMTQFDNSAVPLDAGYNMYLLRSSDIEAGTPPVGPTPEPLTIQVLGTDVVLSWTQPAFNLQASSEVSGGYTNITGATSPYTYPLSEGKKFFRLQYSLP